MAETPSSIQLAQLARLLGVDALPAAPAHRPEAGSPAIDLKLLHAFLRERLERLARGLLEEAVACDDVVDTASAEVYLEDRLAFLGELLSDEEKQRVRELYLAAAQRWQSTSE